MAEKPALECCFCKVLGRETCFRMLFLQGPARSGNISDGTLNL
jgi:hypothetical protein